MTDAPPTIAISPAQAREVADHLAATLRYLGHVRGQLTGCGCEADHHMVRQAEAVIAGVRAMRADWVAAGGCGGERVHAGDVCRDVLTAERR